MVLYQQNFDEAAKLDDIPCGQIQTVIASLWKNTQTRIRLHDAVPDGKQVSFELVKGDIQDIDTTCSYQGVQRKGQLLVCL